MIEPTERINWSTPIIWSILGVFNTLKREIWVRQISNVCQTVDNHLIFKISTCAWHRQKKNKLSLSISEDSVPDQILIICQMYHNLVRYFWRSNLITSSKRSPCAMAYVVLFWSIYCKALCKWQHYVCVCVCNCQETIYIL